MALSNANLGLHEVAHGDQLCNGMLDLNARVHFNEEEVALLIHKELNSTGVAIANVVGQSKSVVTDLFTFLVGEIKRGSNLDDLLMATLNGTVTLIEMYDIAVVITENLYFNMLWILNKLLQEDSGVTERRLGLRGCRLESLEKLFLILRNAHTATATT